MQWRPFNGPSFLKNYAWSALILPYMEAQNVHALVDFDHPFDHPINARARKTNVATYVCPSVPMLEGKSGKTDYGGLYGQRITTRINTDNGVFVYNQPFKFRDIRDGLTFTAAVAEDTGGPDGEWINGSNIFEQSGQRDPISPPQRRDGFVCLWPNALCVESLQAECFGGDDHKKRPGGLDARGLEEAFRSSHGFGFCESCVSV
jgi:hypothetical protein